MKFFNLDCHVSVIADLTNIFTELGHEVTSWSISGHNFIFGRDAAKVDIINQNTWMNLDDKMCDDFYERYKDELSEYDGFICTYPLSFSMLYAKFKKPIILHVPIRYEVPFSGKPNMWNKFNSYLRDGIDSGMIIPVANSEYDKRYFEFFVERECEMIPNICEYTKTEWNPTKKQFLYYSRLPMRLDPSTIVNKDSLGRYRWEDIAEYRGIIMIPYNCSTMSIFEYYSANIPLFCPSEKLMVQLYSQYGSYVLNELTWNRVFGMNPGSSIECDRSIDPNRYDDADIMSKWIASSDFYNREWMPHIVYFESMDDLGAKLRDTDLSLVSSRMKEFNVNRRKSIIDMWDNTLKRIK